MAANYNDFETIPPRSVYSLLLAAHVLEHLRDAPAAVDLCAGWLLPGGELWIIVPDDTDPVNPEHEWVFTPASLRRCVEDAGLTVERIEVRRRIERERFIYLRARKT